VRIIYLHQYFNTPEMSGSTRSYEIGRRLVAAGHTVEMVTSWQEPTQHKDWFTTQVAGMQVHWLPVPYSNHLSYRARIAAFGKFALGAARRTASLHGDVVFATSTPLTIALPAAYASRRKRIPMVFEVRDLWPEVPIAMGALENPVLRWMARRLEKFAYDSASRVVALSPGMAAGVSRVGFPSQRITVVPNAADLDFFRRDTARGQAFRRTLGIADDCIVVGYAGTLGRINGVAYLAHLASALAADRRFAFLAVGDGQERAQVEALARERGVLGQSFHMIGKLPKTAMPEVLSAIDVATSLVVPIRELEFNSANKFFDALSAGCCVGVNYDGWHAQLLEETGSGIRLANDPANAARQLQALADEPGRIRAAGANARALAEQRFSRDVLAARIESVLSTAVQDAAKRR
jgi:glycosyltransferase involved in cell wall biosynthesis